ncbi:GNAT family N-acetyltransferase [Halorhodospira sp. 9628]|uniref:GNAT family N-acetyltransferase n=1 Tax=Halorhodospira sp. 9628 TaxID=2899137 RepID=UPI001EE7C7CC|nr:GNAT family N-acetyltransferase [Halorhodospira sp. 9628]MCG5528012.1 GNAT family N-acetyltransferase [Halorhodospira halophila]MCG5542118.1 GNAT family N-acetyltransferase [Halorhodospira sp. 9628]
MYRALNPASGRFQPWLITRDGEARAALCLGGPRRAWDHGVPLRRYALNETGCAALDRVGLEHNGLLAEGGDQVPAFRALLEHLLQRRDWDELLVGWVRADRWETLRRALVGLPLTPRVEECKPYFYVELSGIADLADYLSGLSANTRYQIRRAMRLYGGPEALHQEAAPDAEQAIEWFEQLVRLHQRHWQTRRGFQGAFAHPRVLDFHRRLVRAAVPRGVVEMFRVRAPAHEVGYLYNLRGGGSVCNYQGGLNYSDDQRLKPGLVCHALAVAHAARQGWDRYDLLVGDSQYKRSLASARGEMLRVRIQRPRWRLGVVRAVDRLLESSEERA